MLYVTKFWVFSFFMLLNSGSIAHHLEANNQGTNVCRKMLFQKSWQFREKVDSCPEMNSEDYAQS